MYMVYEAKRKRPTSCTNMSSLIASGEMFLRRSMVSYMPCSSRSLSTEPSICFSSTRPTRNTIFTPKTRDLSQVSLKLQSKNKTEFDTLRTSAENISMYTSKYQNLRQNFFFYPISFNVITIHPQQEVNVGIQFSYKQTKALRAG